MQFRVDPTQLNNNASALSNLAFETARVSESLQETLTQVTAPGPSTPLYLTGTALSGVINDLRASQQSITALSDSLFSISNAYITAENAAGNAITGNITARAAVPQQIAGSSQVSQNSQTNQVNRNKSIGERYNSSFGDQFWSDLRDSLIEGTGNTIVKIGGLINVTNALAWGTGKNAFVILDPNVVQATSKWINAGQKIATGAKYGLPVIGGFIDFFSLKSSGESTANAAIKSVAHVGISFAGGEAGAALGAAIGSVIPGAGTAVGAAVGFVSGVAISTLGNATFDFLYDNHVAEAVDNFANSVFEGAQNIASSVSEGISNAAESIGQGVQNVFDGIGNAFSGAMSGLGCIFG